MSRSQICAHRRASLARASLVHVYSRWRAPKSMPKSKSQFYKNNNTHMQSIRCSGTPPSVSNVFVCKIVICAFFCCWCRVRVVPPIYTIHIYISHRELSAAEAENARIIVCYLTQIAMFTNFRLHFSVYLARIGCRAKIKLLNHKHTYIYIYTLKHMIMMPNMVICLANIWLHFGE